MNQRDVPDPRDAATSVAFAVAARKIAAATADLGVSAPSFRCPPQVVGVDRAVRRRGNDPADAVVSVRLKNRPWVAVLSDMIEGVVVANKLLSPQADRLRASLWDQCGFGLNQKRAPEPPRRVAS